jgi:hypothetical protein
MADIFVSYKRENKEAVEAVVRGLRGAGLSLWWDQDIAPDAPWEATIERELGQAKVVLVAWSRAAVSSENVKAEARHARTQGKLIQAFVEPCEPPLFFGERQGVDLSGWRGDVNDARFKTLAAAARAVVSGRRPPQGVGYAPPKRSSFAPIVLGLMVLAAVAAAVLNFDQVRTTACTILDVGALCDVRPEQEAAPAEGPARVAPADSGPRLEAGVEYRLEIPAGAAFDLDRGVITNDITDASDFLLVDGGGFFFIDHVEEPAGTQPDTQGSPSRAICNRGEYFYRSYLADPGEYNCFRTGERREGALVRERDRAGFNGAVITYRFWE